jgi:hypothetical protein
MAETKAFPYDVEAARQGLEFDNAPPRELEKHYFRYHAHHGMPETVGITRGFRDRHGRPLVAPDLVPHDHHLAVLILSDGEIFSLDASDDYLLQFVASHTTDKQRTFPRAKHSELRDAGVIKEL